SQSNGLCKDLGVIHRHFIFHVSEITPPEAFGDSQGFCLRMPAHVEPPEVVEACGIDDEGIAFPMSNGITQPGGIEISDVLWKLAPVGVDRSMGTVRRLVKHRRSEERRVGKECRTRWSREQGERKRREVTRGE